MIIKISDVPVTKNVPVPITKSLPIPFFFADTNTGTNTPELSLKSTSHYYITLLFHLEIKHFYC